MDRARYALSNSVEFLASLEPLWRRAMPGNSPAEALGCSEDTWRWIAICRRPRPEKFHQDIEIIANAAKVDRDRLQQFIITSLAVERFQNAPPETFQARTDLLAAREHGNEEK